MNFNDVENILASSQPSDWLFNDDTGDYTYKNDLNLRIKRWKINFESDLFENEEWAIKHPNPKAYRVNYTVFYGASVVCTDVLVSVDGHRAELPMPKSYNQLEISKSDYNFAKIVNQNSSRLDEYLQRANIIVK